jgi:hypothetical protein
VTGCRLLLEELLLELLFDTAGAVNPLSSS